MAWESHPLAIDGFSSESERGVNIGPDQYSVSADPIYSALTASGVPRLARKPGLGPFA
ncbi:hypothetical protein SCLCIDRAFT_1214642 [Scleroderma citrinum Foug A]|uniref:Uncharacterized protein n=1 Tax=Scleroderma citrinum Foug A TaxID=1036808 RepID=A0A0C3DQB4_9AGAM|nr:hypothetical protein SCLCIDRAFT_1214642 [Scleroderma citrinum Foug A]